MVSQNQQNFDNIDDKLVVKVTQELECFKQTFFRLIDKTQKILNQLETRKIMFPDERSEGKIFQQEYNVLSDLIAVYKQLVDRYVVDLALFGWPKVLSVKNNPETFSKLYMVTFAKLQEIQERLAQIIPPAVYTADDDNDKAIDMLHSIMFGYSRSKPIPTFEHKLATFEKEFLHQYY
jgi:hypothetical protein